MAHEFDPQTGFCYKCTKPRTQENLPCLGETPAHQQPSISPQPRAPAHTVPGVEHEDPTEQARHHEHDGDPEHEPASPSSVAASHLYQPPKP